MKKPKRQWGIPYLGLRIIKTTVAVLLCLLTYLLLGYRGASIPTEAAITAIICMQPYLSSAGHYALSRLIGTLIGSFWGLALLLLLRVAPTVGTMLPLPHILMAIGVLLSLYTSNLLHRSDAATQAAIVFLCIVISFPDVDAPLRQTGLRLADIFLGTLISVAVNVFRLPRRKCPGELYFVRTADLVPDRFAQIAPTALFRLNRLSDDGAKICLMSVHAPAFFAQQMSDVRLNAPQIVMDGAAIFDLSDNRFLWKNTVSKQDSVTLRSKLGALGVSYFIYTVHRDKTCIFHRGKYRDSERLIYERMRRSPYRSYLDEEVYDAAEIVYFKIIGTTSEIEALEQSLRSDLKPERIRIVNRDQPGAEGLRALYIYDAASTPDTAKTALLQLLENDGTRLTPVDIALKRGYRLEYDAVHLLHKIEGRYEPNILKPRRKNAPGA